MIRRGVRGIPYPPAGLVTGSVHLHSALMAEGPFLAIIPGSMLRFGLKGLSIRVLPVDLPTPPSPYGIMTLKSRTLGPVARLFVDSLRDVVKPLARHHRT